MFGNRGKNNDEGQQCGCAEIPVNRVTVFRDIYTAIHRYEDFSLGELRFLRRVIDRKLRAGNFRLDMAAYEPEHDCGSNEKSAAL